ncbi:xylan O-acetyltransferase 14 isoform X2 [Magnolia sinica]|uniref:xylan O-acetyltransferase 14 isoform X2 n=1 Tax=Magnolia sinica TaxID=86752 RepID=UPI0026585904|nr:xylan O-acetyltransferase 14 isoform X2 [Magnolia sinica]
MGIKRHAIFQRAFRLNSLGAILLVTLVLVVISITRNNGVWTEHLMMRGCTTAKPRSQCDLSSGRWVFDNVSYPLYSERQCTYMSDQLACEKYGRTDFMYQNWRWQPHQCDLPRFNATTLLERLRGKRLVFVGDSLNRGQWVSMVCLIESVIPSSLKSMHSNGSLNAFKALEYNALVEFYWAPLLVESNSDDPVNHRLPDRIIRANSITKHAKHWMSADILVFNSYLWWRRSKMKVLADEWGAAEDQNCYNEREPVTKDGYSGRASDGRMMSLVDATIQRLRERGVNVRILNITQLSEYRKDGHPSIYRKQWEPLTEEQISKPTSYADCIHWCLPGVPDVWNELLYASIISS